MISYFTRISSEPRILEFTPQFSIPEPLWSFNVAYCAIHERYTVTSPSVADACIGTVSVPEGT